MTGSEAAECGCRGQQSGGDEVHVGGIGGVDVDQFVACAEASHRVAGRRDPVRVDRVVAGDVGPDLEDVGLRNALVEAVGASGLPA